MELREWEAERATEHLARDTLVLDPFAGSAIAMELREWEAEQAAEQLKRRTALAAADRAASLHTALAAPATQSQQAPHDSLPSSSRLGPVAHVADDFGWISVTPVGAPGDWPHARPTLGSWEAVFGDAPGGACAALAHTGEPDGEAGAAEEVTAPLYGDDANVASPAGWWPVRSDKRRVAR